MLKTLRCCCRRLWKIKQRLHGYARLALCVQRTVRSHGLPTLNNKSPQKCSNVFTTLDVTEIGNMVYDASKYKPPVPMSEMAAQHQNMNSRIMNLKTRKAFHAFVR